MNVASTLYLLIITIRKSQMFRIFGYRYISLVLVLAACLALFYSRQPRLFKENEKVFDQTMKDPSVPCLQGTNCHLPDCLCFGIKDYPNHFQRHEIPQIVIFTTDDALNSEYADFYNQIFANHTNPNGCPFTGTMFISGEDFSHDFNLVREFYDKGWEIGQHGFGHLEHEHTDILKNDAKKMIILTNEKTRIPFSELRGWRSPYLLSLGDGEIRTLRRLNFIYSMTFSAGQYAWPFTLDYELKTQTGKTKLRNSPGFWIIPNAFYNARPFRKAANYVDDVAADWSDPTKLNSASEIERILNAAFDKHYHGDRSPFTFNTHGHLAKRNPEALAAIINFFNRMDAFDDVFVITAYKALQWTRSPTKLEDIHKFAPWQC